MYCQYVTIITALKDLLKSLNWTTCQFKQAVMKILWTFQQITSRGKKLKNPVSLEYIWNSTAIRF